MANPRLKRHVDTMWPDFQTLWAKGMAVEDLQGHPGWEAVLAVLDQELATIGVSLEDSNIPLSQAEYALAHGRMGGLRAARQAVQVILETAAKRYEEQQAKHESGAGSPRGG